MGKRNTKQSKYLTDIDYINAVNLFNQIPNEQMGAMGYHGIWVICYMFSIELQILKERNTGYAS